MRIAGFATVVASILLPPGVAVAQQFNVLQSFPGASNLGPVTLSGSTLFGVTGSTIFKINADGSGYQTLATNIAAQGPLTVSGNKIYGETEYGGNGDGTIFSLNTDGTDFQTIYDAPVTGFSPALLEGGLVLSGSTLYGESARYIQAGSNPLPSEDGTVFEINTDGSGFNVVHYFDPEDNPGEGDLYGGGLQPLVLQGSTLYGLSPGGGPSNDGLFYSISTNGSNFQVVNDVSSDLTVGPIGGFTVAAGKIVCITAFGGTYGDGAVYSLNLDGSDFKTIYSFNLADNQVVPNNLIAEGSTVYGTVDGPPSYMTGLGGSIYEINPDGTGFADLGFIPAADGVYPSVWAYSDGTIYGTTSNEGYNGTVFVESVPEPRGVLIGIVEVVVLLNVGRRWRVRREAVCAD
jgi:hypothetical protein